MNFNQYNLKESLLMKLEEKYIKKPTPIQSATIPRILEGQHIFAEAETGTGKTLAFLLPILTMMDTEGLQTLIVAPTRELAIQITEEAAFLSPESRVLSIFGGKDIHKQLQQLNQNVNLIVATPGRLLDHLRRETINLSTIKHFVLDEVDQMLDMGFRDDILILLKHMTNPQVIGYSATVTKSVKKLSYKLTNHPVFVSTKEEEKKEQIKEEVLFTTARNKIDSLKNILDEENPFMAIIFCRTRRRVDKLEHDLAVAGYNVSKLHGGMPQSKRTKAIKSFKQLKIQYLVATEVAARGLDVTGVTHVINYDLPETYESYIHRMGRTGRVDEKGKSYLFVNDDEKELYEKFQNPSDQ